MYQESSPALEFLEITVVAVFVVKVIPEFITVKSNGGAADYNPGSHYGSHKPHQGGGGRGYSHQNHRHHHHARQYMRKNEKSMDRGNGKMDIHGLASPSSVPNTHH